MKHIAICVPVRNEEDHLPRFLQSLAALDTKDVLPPVVFVALDSCVDRSADIIRKAPDNEFPFDLRLITLPQSAEPNAGRARRAVMSAASDAFHAWPDARLLTTDADCVVPANWLQNNETAFRSADVVAGYAERSDIGTDWHRTGLELYLERLHDIRRTIDPISYDARQSHPYVSGASLGVTRAAYEVIGGMPDLACGEDAAFVDRARQAGLRVRQDRLVKVQTSARREGRARNGLATALKSGDEASRLGRAHMVEDPRLAVRQYERHRLSRAAFADLQTEQDALTHAVAAGLSPEQVLTAWRDARSADAFVMRVVPSAPASQPVPLDIACGLLAELEENHAAAFAA